MCAMLFFYFCVQLVFGNSGVLQGIGSGKAYVDMSTVDVETMADVYEVQNSVYLFITHADVMEHFSVKH